MTKRPRRLWISTRIALLLAAVACLMSVAGVRLNVSESVPRGLYLERAIGNGLRRGDYVLLRVDAPAGPSALRSGLITVAHRTLIKRVEGLPGDEITSGALVAVNGRNLERSEWRPFDERGRTMPRPALPLRLGPHQFWLASSHERGIDSRYFGPVDEKAIGAAAEPLWTF